MFVGMAAYQSVEQLVRMSDGKLSVVGRRLDHRRGERPAASDRRTRHRRCPEEGCSRRPLTTWKWVRFLTSPFVPLIKGRVSGRRPARRPSAGIVAEWIGT